MELEGVYDLYSWPPDIDEHTMSFIAQFSHSILYLSS